MDLTSIQTVKSLLKKYAIRPSKRLGQNFLISKSAVKKLIAAADINSEDIILEVGPGIGTITIELANIAKQVIAVEKDRALIPVLSETTNSSANIQILNKDILKFENLEIDCKLKIENWKLVGNIPYYLTAPLIRKFLESKNPPKSIVFIIQKEMAQRICASPPDMSILAVSVQFYANAEIITYIPRSSFWPMPKVDSAIIKITPRAVIARRPSDYSRRADAAISKTFFKTVRAGFSNPRKQLGNNLSKELLRAADIDPTRRAETLTVKEWVNISKIFNPQTF